MLYSYEQSIKTQLCISRFDILQYFKICCARPCLAAIRWENGKCLEQNISEHNNLTEYLVHNVFYRSLKIIDILYFIQRNPVENHLSSVLTLICLNN
jgi:hypothetical protein